MHKKTLRLATLAALLALTLLLVGCNPAEPEEAFGTPESGKMPGTLPEAGGPVTGTLSVPEVMTSTAPTAGGQVTGTTPGAGETVTGTAGMDSGINRVQVVLKEYHIEMVDTLPPGPTLFDITNAGNWQHGFVIEGNGMQASLEKPLEIDELGQVQVDLHPGVYEIHCPVDGHAGLGMTLELNVTE